MKPNVPLKPLLVLLVVATLSSCFKGLDLRGTVRKYDKGLVQTIGGSFSVGRLPDIWKSRKIDENAALLQNQQDNATITLSSWCKGAFNDGTLAELSQQLYGSLVDYKILEQRTLPIDDREGLITAVTGTLDGKPMYLKTFVLKMNQCVFDFVYVTVPEARIGETDFDAMVSGFHFISGPDIL